MPPLTALRAFEAAGRLGGFTPAALELGVTPGAVTAHLKTLESTLGVALFERHHRGVSLTEVGARVLPEFTAAFDALGAAVQTLEAEAAPGLVRIATTPDLALLWLSPRLPALRRQGLQVVPVPVDHPAAARGVADLALFLVEADADTEPLIAVAAPDLAVRLTDAGALIPADCLVLRGAQGDWGRWTRAAGLTGFVPKGTIFAQAPLAIEETAHGAGVLVIARPLVQAALEAGRVAQILGSGADSGLALWLWSLRDGADGAAVARVRAALDPG
ncbi:MAG: LysR family transcriptional regulator [Rhodobacteraceae bacterium]|jgi:LysR family glycine cleavage system transcriptional activator|nr:LysR family transcriptional regulator [Paracoccaceae bacterium]